MTFHKVICASFVPVALLSGALTLAVAGCGDDGAAQPEVNNAVDVEPNPLASSTLAVGRARSCVVDRDGAAWCWGLDVFPLEPDFERREGLPGLTRLGGATGVVSVSTHYGLTCLVDGAGRLWCEDGDGLVLAEGIDDLVEVSAACVLRADGSAFCGSPSPGAAGVNPVPSGQWAPLEVPGRVVTVQAELLRGILALDEDGVVWSGPSPDRMVALSAPVRFVALDASYEASCAIAEDATVWCWGSEDAPATPTKVPGLSDVVVVAAGHRQSCAIVEGGSVRCWQTREPTPAPTPLGIEDAVAIDLSVDHGCAVRATGQLTCWGANDRGQAGAPMPLPDGSVVEVALENVVKVHSRESQTCALTREGAAWCWGGLDGSVPVRLEAPAPIVDIQVGGNMACFLTDDQRLWCWGVLPTRRLEDPAPIDAPVHLEELGEVTAFAVGGDEVCALRIVGDTEVDEVMCAGGIGACRSHGRFRWFDVDVEQLVAGANSAGVLDSAGVVSRWGESLQPDFDTCMEPTPVAGLAGARMISATRYGLCGLFEDEVRCVEPAGSRPVPGMRGAFASLATNLGFTIQEASVCAVRADDGSVECVGALESPPAEVSGLKQLSLGSMSGCGVREDGRVVCWGANDRGQLGDEGARFVEGLHAFFLR